MSGRESFHRLPAAARPGVGALAVLILTAWMVQSDSGKNLMAVDDDRATDDSAGERGSDPDHGAIERPYREMLRQTREAAVDSQNVSLYSRRGDALFFTGQYTEAVAAYEKMVELQPSLDASHWRLGIALFFANQADDAVAQFEKYHAYDDVDRENGIWRYLSQYRATNARTARKELLRYQKDDREPFPAVYRLFDDSLTPEAALSMIPDDLPAAERDKRLFYTELYIGMHLVVKQQPAQAIPYLQKATSRQWPQRAGGGPEWMWQVGRLQLKDLMRQQKKSEPDKRAVSPKQKSGDSVSSN